ncbi:MAG: bacterioferritin [Myxococcota bacterium]
MRGDPAVIEALNSILTAELTAINQYFIHAKMCRNWGLLRLAKHNHDESIDEMKHADAVIERILFLDGVPNMQRLGSVRVGEAVPEQFKLDLELELEAVKRYNGAIVLCTDKNDAGTRELLEDLLKDEEGSVDWHEAQLGLIQKVGIERYLSEQLKE